MTRRRAWLARLDLLDRVQIASVLTGASGIVIGLVLARTQSVPLVSGLAWSATVGEARKTLATLLGIQGTVLGLLLTLNTLVLQIFAGQYSPRLQALYARNVSVRRGLPTFAFSAAFTLAAVLVLGFEPEDIALPRPVLGGAFVLLVVVIVLLGRDLLSTLNNMRIEVVLRSLADAGIAAVGRLPIGRRDCKVEGTNHLAGAAPLLAARRGYIVDIDLVGLEADAVLRDSEIRIDRWVGDFVDDGECVGWIRSRGGSTQTDTPGFAQAVRIARARDLTHDVGLSLRLLVDIADRALSAAVNDPYTARQALDACRSVFHRLVNRELGDIIIFDATGTRRVTVAAPSLEDFLSLVTDGPARFGAGDSDTTDALLAIARDVALAANDLESRNAGIGVARRVLAEVRSHPEIAPSRLYLLESAVFELERAVEGDAVKPNLHPRWGIG